MHTQGCKSHEKSVHAFLERFHPNRRGVTGGFFYAAIRSGSDTPESVVAAVAFELQQRLLRPWIDDEDRRQLQDIQDALQFDPDGAEELAAQCLYRERMPTSERAAQKNVCAEAGRRHWMATQPPTEKQNSYLRNLGCDAVPSNRWQASEWIDEFVARRAGR